MGIWSVNGRENKFCWVWIMVVVLFWFFSDMIWWWSYLFVSIVDFDSQFGIKYGWCDWGWVFLDSMSLDYVRRKFVFNFLAWLLLSCSWVMLNSNLYFIFVLFYFYFYSLNSLQMNRLIWCVVCEDENVLYVWKCNCLMHLNKLHRE